MCLVEWGERGILSYATYVSGVNGVLPQNLEVNLRRPIDIRLHVIRMLYIPDNGEPKSQRTDL